MSRRNIGPFPIGRAFFEWRKAQGWTIDRACAETGVCVTEWKAVENGIAYPLLTTLDTMRRETGLDPYLMGYCWYQDYKHLPQPVVECLDRMGEEFRKYLALIEGGNVRRKLW